ncbi:MAG TPA: glycosyltransferase [Alphaproteobacteria bacterium]|nr:glycosyltransferase [Alphaproteobacteria bacterium]
MSRGNTSAIRRSRSCFPAKTRNAIHVALVHDYLNQRGGAERVFAHIARAWPQAPVFTALYDERAVGDLIPPERVYSSMLARIPGANRNFRYLAPLYPRAFESFDLREYDLILSSTSAWAKGVRIRPGAVHVCFIHTVSRFLFDYERYVGGFGLSQLARPMVRGLVRWDLEAAKRPTRYVANSRTVQQRVRDYYHRDADVLHSPADLDRFTIGSGSGDYFFIASRLLPYKRIDLAIDAAQLAGVKLLVAGDGPAMAQLRERARSSTTTMLGFVDDAAVNQLLGNAIAAIVPGEEDLGLVPIEAAATGRPTIAYRSGGARETVIEGETGAFFDEPDARSLAAVLRGFDPRRYDAQRLRSHAEAFSPQRFIASFRGIVEAAQA